MDEEKKTPEEGKKAEADTPTGDKPVEVDPFKRADERIERMEAANKKREELLEREERLAARKLLGGDIEAGQPEPKKEEMTPEEYSKKAMAGEVGEPKQE